MPKVTQEEAFHFLTSSDRNIFLTGAGGCGKTKIINDYIKYCADNNISYGLTASTGIAAQLLNGQTVHSFLGLGTGTKEVQEIVSKNWFKKRIEPILQDIDLLIVDEVSMIGSSLFDKKSQILKYCLDFVKPFGGLRIILVGDFFQLAPVQDEYCFKSEAWKEGEFMILNLFKNYRSISEKWTNILKKIRIGTIDSEVKEFLLSRFTFNPPEDCLKVVCMNYEADKINRYEYNKIRNTEEITYYYSVSDPDEILNEQDITNFFDSHVINQRISLKVGTRVMIKVNSRDQEYVNGSMGEVVYIDKDEVVVELDSDHSQVVIKKTAFVIEKKVPNPDFNKKKKKNINNTPEFIVKSAKIICMPIIYGYALTSHNCQGITLDSAVIDLSKGFTDGQAYVALSRVKNPDKLYLTGFPSPESLSVSQDVIDFVMEHKDEFLKRLGE